MRRWTDGKSWSASRVSGSFLTYREMEGKRGGANFSAPSKANRDGVKGSDQENPDDGPDGYRYKPDGLMKQSFSITTSTGQHLHLISYFARSAPTSQTLKQPSTDPQLRHIRPEKGMYPESTVHEQSSIPAVTRGPMTSPGFAPSPHQSANIGSPYTRAPPYGVPGYPGPHGWAPPSPMHTPPPNYSPYYHANGHPPSALGHSPLQQMHNAYQPHPQSFAPPPTAFDRPPPPLMHNALPPPPQPHQHQMPPVHNGHPQSYGPPPTYPSQPPPPQHHDQQRYTSAPAIDPKLSTSAGAEDRQGSAPPARSNDAIAGAQSQRELEAKPQSSATTIPSISSLINDAPAAAAEHSAARSASRSPNGHQLHQTQDIPVHKLGYDARGDAQALRHLDKATLRF